MIHSRFIFAWILAVSFTGCGLTALTKGAATDGGASAATTATPPTTPTPVLRAPSSGPADDDAINHDERMIVGDKKIGARSKMSSGEKLTLLIVKDDALLDFIYHHEKKARVTCTRPSPGQIHWACRAEDNRVCHFVLEITCVNNINTRVTPAVDNDQLSRLAFSGDADSSQMSFKITDPAQSATVSKTIQMRFEYP